ncbi:MAG: ABC transporter substrate-binding protein [Acetobacteraceae bacterium]
MEKSNLIPRRTALRLGAVTGAAALAGRSASAATPESVQVALVTPLSGPWARDGHMERSGAEMAIADINASGGIKALGGAKMELFVYDAGSSTETATDAAKRMVAQHPDLTGGDGAWLSSFTLAVTEVTERAKLPWLTLSYSDAITGRGFQYVFQTSPTANHMTTTAIPVFVDLYRQSTGKTPTTIAIIADNTAADVSFLKPISSELKEEHLKLVAKEIFTPPLADATAIVSRVRAARPDLVLMPMTATSDMKLVLDKFNEFHLGWDRLPKMGAGGFLGDPELRQIIGDNILQGLMVILANWPGKGQEALNHRFVERTREPWMNQDAFITYINFMILKEAIERAGTRDRIKVADAIRSLDLNDEGPAKFFPSRHLQFDKNGRLVDAETVIIQWQDGVPSDIYPASIATVNPIWPKV